MSVLTKIGDAKKVEKRNFLKKQLEILQEKATDMTVRNYQMLYDYYQKKLEETGLAKSHFDYQIPTHLKTKM